MPEEWQVIPTTTYSYSLWVVDFLNLGRYLSIPLKATVKYKITVVSQIIKILAWITIEFG